MLCNFDSYRTIASFIKAKFEFLKSYFNLKWKTAPSYSAIRNIILSVEKKDIEDAFRKYSADLVKDDIKPGSIIAIDGKTLKGSYDNIEDEKAIHVLSAFFVEKQIILAHEQVDTKTNEIPVAQELIQELGLEDCILTLDALNTQKKL